MGKRHGPEEIIGKLREAEIVLAQGHSMGADYITPKLRPTFG